MSPLTPIPFCARSLSDLLSFSFLVANEVYVASVPPATAENPNPVQHVFASNSEAAAFDVYPDPRGNTLGRGTEITLILKDDAEEYVEEHKVRDLM